MNGITENNATGDSRYLKQTTGLDWPDTVFDYGDYPAYQFSGSVLDNETHDFLELLSSTDAPADVAVAYRLLGSYRKDFRIPPKGLVEAADLSAEEDADIGRDDYVLSMMFIEDDAGNSSTEEIAYDASSELSGADWFQYVVDLAVSSKAYPGLDRSPKKNWVDKVGGLPDYIERIAKHLHYGKGYNIGRSIAIAVNNVKRMCATGDLNFKGNQSVTAATRAKSCKAVAEWEAKKKAASSLSRDRTFKPPAKAKTNAAKGLRLREKFGRGGQEAGVSRAKQLLSGESLSYEDVVDMYGWFARHVVDAKADGWGDDENPSTGWIAWLLWGGNETRDWIVEVKEEADEEEVDMAREVGFLDFADFMEFAKKMGNPLQPRWPEGSGRKSGRWVKVGSAVPTIDTDAVEDSIGEEEARRRYSSYDTWPEKSQLATDILGEDHNDTNSKYRTGDGEEDYTPERLALHNQIIEKMLEGKTPSEDKRVLFMAGGSGSGKTTLTNYNPDLFPGGFNREEDSRGRVKNVPANAVVVDPDEIKAELPEYKRLSRNRDPYGATAVHHESGDIAAKLSKEAARRGLNVVMDGTGNSEPGKFENKLKNFSDFGYKVDVAYANVPTELALKRNIDRAVETARFVPPSVIKDIHKRVSSNFSGVAKLPFVDNLKVYQTNGTPELIAEGRSGSLNVVNERKYRDFLAKGNS